MKISIVIQHYNRRNLLINTLNSIKESLVKKSNIEIIITDDASDDNHNIDDLEFLYPDFCIKSHIYKKEEKWWTCPVLPINKGISMVTGDVIILLCAECMFIGDIIKDVLERIKSNDYLVYATLALSKEDTDKIDDVSYKYLLNNIFDGNWYQHSVHRNLCYNFCTAIMKDDLLDLGGFDERYADGVDYGDDDFILRVRRKNMNVISVDYPMVYHQNHSDITYQNFNRKLESEEVNNFIGVTLYNHVLDNEKDNYSVKNSYLLDSNFIPVKPELEEMNTQISFNISIKKTNSNFFVEFYCDTPIKLDVDITDSNGLVFNKQLLSRTWFSQNFGDSIEVKISLQKKVIYYNFIISDFEFNHNYVMLIKLFRPKDILTYNKSIIY